MQSKLRFMVTTLKVAVRGGALLLLTLQLGVVTAQADPIMSVTGPNTGNLALYPGQALGISFSLTSGWTNVDIIADLLGSNALTGFAYLTTQVGPGTTPSDEVASGSFFLPMPQGPVSIFSGLTLDAGTYFLTLSNTGSGGWVGTNIPTFSAGPGVTRNTDYYAGNPGPDPLAYTPASQFFFISGPYYGILDIKGTPVPEPSSIFMIGAGLAALATAAWRKRQ